REAQAGWQIPLCRKIEPRRQNAKDVRRHSVQRNHAPDDAGVRLESAPPEPIGNQDGARALRVLWSEGAAERWSDAEHVEEVVADAHSVDAFGIALSGQVEALGSNPRQPLKSGVARPEVGDITWRRRQRVEPGLL